MFTWLSLYHSNTDMIRREISYILPAGDENTDDEFCVRNLSYTDWKAFKEDVIRLTPLRIDIGAIFDGDVKNNKDKVDGLSITPVEREFVIDIDMTDYDHIRTCCEGKKLCDKCWTYVRAAYKVLTLILSKAFGFKHILWVFSGRRGMHAWICDREARLMSKKVRKAITEFLNFTITNDKVNYLVKPELINRTNEYPLLVEAYEKLKEYTSFLLDEQKILSRPNIYEQVISIVERYMGRELTAAEKDTLETIGPDHATRKFKYLVSLIDQTENGSVNSNKFKIEFVLGYLYPKIDSHVSAQVNHLLKAPFNIHHASMNISVPIMDIEKFNIENAFSVHEILKKEAETGRNPIAEYIAFFKNFCTLCEKDAN